MTTYAIVKTLARIVLIILLAFAVLWINNQLPPGIRFEQAGVFGGVVLLAVLYYIIELIIGILFVRTLPPK